MEGETASEGSDRVSRVLKPDEDAGLYGRDDETDGLGHRGYVRRAESRFIACRRRR